MGKFTDKVSSISEEILDDDINKIKKYRKKNGSIGDAVIVLTALALVVCTAFLVKNLVISGVTNFATSFSNASSDSEAEAYLKYYDESYSSAYDKARKENAINNDIYIAVDEIREMSKYEVLSVIEDATIIETEEQKANGIYSWVRYKGKGEYTVDLEHSEIIVDHKNYYVSIRIPHPKMTYVPLDTETQTLLYKDGRKSWLFFDRKDSATGVDIAEEQKSKANMEIYAKLEDNASYQKKADDAAISGLTQLVKTLNRDIADKLIIEISFND